MSTLVKTDNELIAEFMGYEIGVVDYFGTKDETEWQRTNKDWLDEAGIESVGTYAVNFLTTVWFDWDEVAYDTSWDWLMPVVEKIESLGCYELIIRSNFVKAYCFDPFKLKVIHVEAVVENKSKIQATYKAVVEFIRWYNSQKQ